MRNWRVTPEGHLRLRPGTQTVVTLGETPVRALWRGNVAGTERLLAAAAGRVWSISGGAATDLGAVTDGETAHFFGFSGKVYLLNGSQYKVWDGTTLSDVEGYAPVVAVATPPGGGGTLSEPVNKLTGKKRQRFSPDGSSAAFKLAEEAIDEVYLVKLNGVDQSGYTADLKTGRVTLQSAPAAGVNTLEIGWRKGSGDRAAVTAMRYSETFNGAADTRVFLYGDGSNRALYSGINENGQPDASYFPDLNVVDVDSANTPITAMVRHFDRLLAFKTDGLWALEYGTLTLADGSTVPGFPVIPINREIGNLAPGQARLVDNCPVTLHGRGLYRWAVSGTAVRDERTAERISARAEATLSGMSGVTAFDHEANRELYLFSPEATLVYNYGKNVFYVYTGLAPTCAAVWEGALHLGTADGRLLRVSDEYRNDDGAAIHAYWESGSMALERDWSRKYATRLLAVLKPESGARVTLTVRTNRRGTYPQRLLTAGLMTFGHQSFEHFAFGTSRMPQTRRVRLRMSRFVYCKLILSSASASAAATVLAADVEFAYGGKAR